MNIISLIFYPGIAFVVLASLIYSGISRKIAARMQSRIGPPIIQPVYDMIKLFSKEGIVPENAKTGFLFWPIAAISAALVSALIIPIFGSPVIGSDIIVLIYFMALASLSVYMAGFASSNTYAAAGAIRGITQMFAYELPFAISVIVPAVALGTLSPFEIATYQTSNGWLVFTYPFACIAFVISMLAKVELPPFHIPNAHQELVGGYSIEFTGIRLAFIELAHMVKLFALIALSITLFFGGASSLMAFIGKSLVLLFAATLSRAIMARLRIDQALRFYWILGIVALIDLVRVIA